jgi:hypothetical protein
MRIRPSLRISSPTTNRIAPALLYPYQKNFALNWPIRGSRADVTRLNWPPLVMFGSGLPLLMFPFGLSN